jgi:hypothetical protein
MRLFVMTGILMGSNGPFRPDPFDQRSRLFEKKSSALTLKPLETLSRSERSPLRGIPDPEEAIITIHTQTPSALIQVICLQRPAF